ncbi:MFS transporter [Rhodanobacter denitrificans]|uniref:MFS transporter n=1 Tax=Rhodanobacter TaxID=75309 RepID=UPI000260E602|nr:MULTISPECIES: MFS transporter [Rhodanobacter]EIM03142.1 major facilitator superfamily protein [Rhodanobacter denitrificans]UJM90342.1 MFS transporter [Rhodanobacter denitrificans]
MASNAIGAIGNQADAALDVSHKRVILASSLGTVFEWYDFYLYGSLAVIIGHQFFSGLNEASQLVFALLAFAAGFAVRPFGALVFGRVGDLVGRKYTFLITIVIMGLSTFFVGLLPSYGSIGVAAPVILIALRMLQGLALGGEYGGAATYVAEHAPHGKRGLYTSFIQITATFGLFLSLLVILGCKWMLGDKFNDWGWRIPFLLSSLLLAISVYIRLQLAESPVFKQMKEEGKQSKAPLTESFARWGNLKLVILALLGATAGQAVVWYCGQFYAMYFLGSTLKIDATTTQLLIAAALVIGTPFFVVFGWLSDKIGRKPVVLAGCLLAALTYFPIFKGLTHYGNPAIEAASVTSPVKVLADPAGCSVQIDLIGKKVFTSSCDVAKSYLAKRGVPYENVAAAPGTLAVVSVGGQDFPAFEGGALAKADFTAQGKAFGDSVGKALAAAGYPAKADPAQTNTPMVILLLTILVLYVTMVYGPIAAWLVEMFPTRIRYTSMSLPYHIGNGWFGGFLPSVSFGIVAATGNFYAGLWYPVVIATMTFVIGMLFVRETKDVDLND